MLSEFLRPAEVMLSEFMKPLSEFLKPLSEFSRPLSEFWGRCLNF